MKAKMKDLLTVSLFKKAFLVDEGPKRKLAMNMAISLSYGGFKGFRSDGMRRKKGHSLYTLESLFKVCKLMGAEEFNGVLPSPERHREPSKEITLDEFWAILFLNGNNVGRLISTDKDYYSISNNAPMAALRKIGNTYVYDYEKLAEIAERFGFEAPPLSNVDQKGESQKPALPAEIGKQGMLSLVSIDNIDSEFEGVDGTRCLRYIATACTGFGGQLDYVAENGDYTLKCMKENNRLQQENNRLQQENNRLLRELLNIWKGEQSND